MVVYPYFVLVELLAPVVEAMGLLGVVAGTLLNVINWPFALLFFLAAYGYGILLSVLTLLLEEFTFRRYQDFGDRARLLFWGLLENLGYRQMTLVWRLWGLLKFFRGRREWGVMERRGFSPKPS